MNKKEHKNGEVYYLLHASYTWISENNLTSLNSLVVKNYIGSNFKELKKSELGKQMHQKLFDIERNAAVVNIKQEHVAEPSNGKYQAHTGDKHIPYDKSFTQRFQLQNPNFITPIIIPAIIPHTPLIIPGIMDILFTPEITGENQFICNICNCSNRLKQMRSLKIHQMIHTGEKPFTCDVCDRKFETNSVMKIHQLTHTGEKPYTCDICEKRFTTSSDLKIHQVAGDKHFKCNICEMTFGQKYVLKNHQLTHNDYKLFICNICDKIFKRNSDLKTPELSHTDDKLFTCDTCDQKFKRSDTLKRHKLSHTGDKPFKCEICNTSFTQNYNLKRHQLTHSGNKNCLT